MTQGTMIACLLNAEQLGKVIFLLQILIFSNCYSLKLEYKYAGNIESAFVSPNATEEFKKLLDKFAHYVDETITVSNQSSILATLVACDRHRRVYDWDSLQPGNDTDLLIAVTPADAVDEHKSLIYMDGCVRLKDRHVLGRLHVSKRFTVKPISEQETLNWLTHALLHALAFNQEALSNSTKRKDDNHFVESVKVVAELNFECAALEGAELADQLIIPSWAVAECLEGGVHWKKLHYGDDVMSYPPGPVITTLTAAVLATVGYNVNGAKPLKWAKGRKCDFVNKGCMSLFVASNGSPGSSQPFCNWQDYVIMREKRFRCDSEYTQVVACNWRRYSSEIPQGVPLLFENATAKIGLENLHGKGLAGNEPAFEYCPTWMGIFDYKEKMLKTCTNEIFQPKLKDNFGLEVYNASSICVEQEKVETLQCDMSVIKKRMKGVFLGAGCYEYKCESGRLHLRAYAPAYLQAKASYVAQFKVCWGEGSRVVFSRMFGSEDDFQYDHRVILICPSCKAICEDNPKYKNFTCSPDVCNASSRDYIGWFCGRGSRANSDMLLYSFLLLINVMNSFVQ